MRVVHTTPHSTPSHPPFVHLTMDQEASATQGKHDDENDDESSVSSASSSSYERNRRRRKKHKKRKRYDSDEEEARRRKKRKKHRRRSSSSSSSSESSRRKKRKRKHKKRHKKKKSQEESDRESDDGAPQFGKYGIIKAADFNRMQRSFSIWLAEVKGIPSLSSRYEQQKYFTDFCEDYVRVRLLAPLIWYLDGGNYSTGSLTPIALLSIIVEHSYTTA